MTKTRIAAALAAGTVLMGGLVACSGGGDGDKTVITLSAPNQWTTSGSDFGVGWDNAIAAFEADNPDIDFQLNVLPLDSFYNTISTQLSSGTATELVFNQATFEPQMVTPLGEYLEGPNPFADGNERWLDLFDPRYFGPDAPGGVLNAQGDYTFVTLSLYAPGFVVNKAIFEEVGVDYPIETYADLIDACGAFREAGYSGLALDNSNVTLGQVWPVLLDMLMRDELDDLSVFDATGAEGTNSSMTIKSWAKAVAEGSVSTSTPEVEEALVLLKQVWDECGTPNWSGITNTSGAVAGAEEFAAGQAAMAWGNTATQLALEDANLDLATQGFPMLTTETTSLADDVPARYGAYGGASYMIPSTVEGDKLDAAVRFLQWMTSPDKVTQWLDESASIPALAGAEIPEFALGLTLGEWGEPMQFASNLPASPDGVAYTALFEGYLLGDLSLADEQVFLQDNWNQYVAQQIEKNGWSGEAWTQG